MFVEAVIATSAAQELLRPSLLLLTTVAACLSCKLSGACAGGAVKLKRVCTGCRPLSDHRVVLSRRSLVDQASHEDLKHSCSFEVLTTFVVVSLFSYVRRCFSC